MRCPEQLIYGGHTEEIFATSNAEAVPLNRDLYTVGRYLHPFTVSPHYFH